MSNQCDGCMRGLPVRDGIHYDVGRPYIGCTKDRYESTDNQRRKKTMKLFLVVIYGDVEPDILGPYDSDDLRIEAAKEYRRKNGDRDGLFRLNIDPYGKPDMEPFGSAEIDE